MEDSLPGRGGSCVVVDRCGVRGVGLVRGRVGGHVRLGRGDGGVPGCYSIRRVKGRQV